MSPITTPARPATSHQPVFIAFQANHDTRPLIDAIREDNPQAVVDELPGLVKVTAPGALRICRPTVEAHLGRDFDLREVHLHLVSLSGEIDESDDEFTLQWRV